MNFFKRQNVRPVHNKRSDLTTVTTVTVLTVIKSRSRQARTGQGNDNARLVIHGFLTVSNCEKRVFKVGRDTLCLAYLSEILVVLSIRAAGKGIQCLRLG